MKTRIRAVMIVALLLMVQLACNMPSAVGGGQATPEIPAPNQTLTALFAVTPEPVDATPTSTLPPVITATSDSAGGGQAPTATATQAPANNPTATATTAPVNNPTATTAAQVATATIPAVRPRAQVVANFLNTPPTLDGDWAEWKDITREYPATNVVFGRGNWANEDDLAGSFHVGWDNNNLYIAVKVRDDVYVQNATGENIFKGDCIEILLDTKLRDDFYYDKLSPDDYQLGLTPGKGDINGAKEAYLWFPSGIAGNRNDVKIASRAEGGVYRLEAAIPWSVFGVTPAAGMNMGFAVSMSDNDNAGENLQQTMVSNDPERNLANPTTWGNLLLQK